MEPVLLIYHMNPQKAAAMSSFCRFMKIRPVKVPVSEDMVPIGLLTGSEDPLKVIKEAEKRVKVVSPHAIDEEMIIMAGFSESLFASFLAGIRQNGLGVDLKAVETDENRFWNGGMLLEELKKERQAFQKRS